MDSHSIQGGVAILLAFYALSEISSFFSCSYSYDLTHNLQHQMTPIVNPQPSPKVKDSWQAWKPCSHFDKETAQDISLDLTQSVADRSEPEVLKEDRILDQTTTCDEQISSGELNNDVSTSDGQVQSSDVITDNTEKEDSDGTLNDRLASNSDENSASTSINANTNEQNQSIDDIANLPAKESTSTDDPVKYSNTRKVPSCPECMKLRHRKEKVFLSKNKSCAKFAWNQHLLRGFEGAVHPDWILHIVNGFVGQSGILSFECLYFIGLFGFSGLIILFLMFAMIYSYVRSHFVLCLLLNEFPVPSTSVKGNYFEFACRYV